VREHRPAQRHPHVLPAFRHARIANKHVFDYRHARDDLPRLRFAQIGAFALLAQEFEVRLRVRGDFARDVGAQGERGVFCVMGAGRVTEIGGERIEHFALRAQNRFRCRRAGAARRALRVAP